MQNEKGKQANFQEAYNVIVAHEMGCCVECNTTVIQKNTRIHAGMHN
jgi:hypothetical protein